VEHDLGLVWVVMDNNAFGTIAGLQKAHYDTTYGTTFPGQIGDSMPDYAAIAEAYGAVGMKVRAADEFRGALEKALEMNRPVVIDVPMRNNPTPTTGHWNILDIYSPEGGKGHVATDGAMAREITPEERQMVDEMVARARAAMDAIADYDQATVDRLAQAIGWAVGNEKTFTRLAHMSVDESGIGDREGRPNKRLKIQGILRDVLRQPSMGVIDEDPVRGIVKYAKPAAVDASIVPMTNPELTPPGTAINAIKAKDAVIFSPHPRTKGTTNEVVRIMREVLEREGAPADLFQCIEQPSIPVSQYLMASCDMVLATGGKAMVKAAYSSGKPAFGVGAGNSTIVIDETADIEEAARNTMLSKTSDFGSGCSADGNVLVASSIYEAFRDQL